MVLYMINRVKTSTQTALDDFCKLDAHVKTLPEIREANQPISKWRQNILPYPIF
jgi:hypothetical protein